MDPILITGGTGTLGRHVLAQLAEAGHPDVRVLSRRPGAGIPGVASVTGDLTTGTGIDAAVAGAGTILHLAGTAKGDEAKAETLVRAAVAAGGAPHVIFVSVVGADRIPVRSGVDRAMFGYYADQHAAEQVIAGSGLPWTTLRATQFHDFVWAVASGLAKMPLVPTFADVRFQPVEAAEVAAELIGRALAEPAGLVPDLGGPRVYAMADLVRSYLQARRLRRILVPLRPRGAAARALRAGANLAAERAVGRRTWESYLAERVASLH